MYADVNRRDRQKRLKARRNPLPADHQATILLLEPSKGAFGLESWHHFFDRSPPGFFRLPDPLGDLRPDTPLAELLPQPFGIIPFIRRDHLQTCAGTAPVARADLDGLKPGQHVGPRVSIGRR